MRKAEAKTLKVGDLITDRNGTVHEVGTVCEWWRGVHISAELEGREPDGYYISPADDPCNYIPHTEAKRVKT